MIQFITPSGEVISTSSTDYVTPGSIFIKGVNSNVYYIGASWSSRYKGVRSDSQIYIGPNSLR